MLNASCLSQVAGGNNYKPKISITNMKPCYEVSTKESILPTLFHLKGYPLLRNHSVSFGLFERFFVSERSLDRLSPGTRNGPRASREDQSPTETPSHGRVGMRSADPK